jgi:2-keto-4-pentenoate hydratase/2-oxohepta-3-ene-1,7-dioic acid hydratase in catechol pathway
MTLQPGDVVWLGTDGATEPSLKDGDTVEVSQKDIGVLKSPVRRAKA